jgi:hypothetical protein
MVHPPTNRQKQTLFILGSGFLLVVLVYGGYRFFNPYDEVATEIEGIPSDTVFVCLVADSEDGLKALPWSLAKVIPFSMHPDNCTVSSTGQGESKHRAKVRWINANRIGVLRKTAAGEWRVAWFEMAKAKPKHRSFLLGGGLTTLDVSQADGNESMTVEQLHSLGMDKSLTHN